MSNHTHKTPEQILANKLSYLKWKAKIDPAELKKRQKKINKKYRSTHPERQKQDYIKYKESRTYKKQYEIYKEYKKQWHKNKRTNDPKQKIIERLRARLYSLLKENNTKKQKSAKQLLGCSINKIAKHLEKQFQSGMTWENMGKWHIDHIIPCSVFNLTKIHEQEKCFHYSNLQPLWAADNLKKGNKITFIEDSNQ
jgi:hypothetical protein